MKALPIFQLLKQGLKSVSNLSPSHLQFHEQPLTGLVSHWRLVAFAFPALQFGNALRHSTTLAFRKFWAGAYTQMGSWNCSGMGDSSFGSPARLRCSTLLCGWKLFFWPALSEHGGTCHFGPLLSLLWPLGHVHLIRVLDLVYAAFVIISTC